MKPPIHSLVVNKYTEYKCLLMKVEQLKWQGDTACRNLEISKNRKFLTSDKDEIDDEIRKIQKANRSDVAIVLQQANACLTVGVKGLIVRIGEMMTRLDVKEKWRSALIKHWLDIRNSKEDVFYYNPNNPRDYDGTHKGAIKICAKTLVVLDRKTKIENVLEALEA